MKLHKYCALLPRMMAEEYQLLKTDIQAHGLLEPIVTYEGSILDGRHRYNICEELAVQLVYVEFQSLGYNGSPLDFVISKHQRRNLTPDQKAVLADKIAGLKHGEHQSLTNETLVTLSEALISTGASKGQVGKLRKIKKDNPKVIERIESGETSINIEYQRNLTKQRNAAITANQEVQKQRSQDGYAGMLPVQEQQRFNAGIELKQQNEDMQSECKNKNRLRSALVQIASSVETLKDAVTAFGIEETLRILSSANEVSGMSSPLLLLANIRSDLDDFLSCSNAINDEVKPHSFQEMVRQQHYLQ
jgi:hypothetical protein